MKKLFTISLTTCLYLGASAQNVGIGTATPQAKLEVKNAGTSAIKIRSNYFLDTTRLILSNRTPSENGTDFILSSNMETGLNISSASDLSQNTQPSIAFFSPQGNVGIGNSNPNNRLDVSGNINVTGTIKANGFAGSAGQFLSSNGAGGMSWASAGFQNQAVYSVTSFPGTTADFNWTVPAGVSKIQVELWSAGGHGGYSNGTDSVRFFNTETFFTTGGGGGGGGYAAALLTVSPAQVLAIHVPAGGEGGYAAITNGANAIYMNNGNDGSNAFGSGGSGGNFGGSTGTFLNVFWLKGEDGAYYTQTRHSYVFGGENIRENINNYGEGGSSPNTTTRGVGGIRNEQIIDNSGSTIRRFNVRKGSNGGFPGGGGGGGISPSDPGPTGVYSYPIRGLGAGGMVIIHY
ncbi:MAG: hypothetical protein ABIX01_00405 [Chitinophagaceae bacterium]